uniref:Uncharacterized protein n=1 Tax=Heterorhabditis bacteriophora TaxID=37862 RepID=A0A1I7W7R6_HETBA
MPPYPPKEAIDEESTSAKEGDVRTCIEYGIRGEHGHMILRERENEESTASRGQALFSPRSSNITFDTETRQRHNYSCSSIDPIVCSCSYLIKPIDTINRRSVSLRITIPTG